MSLTAPDVFARIDKILREYKRDKESAHIFEDDLLWEFVAEMAKAGNAVALVLLELNAADRTRWYA